MAYPVKQFDTETEKDAAIAEVERRTGPSNFFRAMSHRPDATRAVFQFYQTVMSPGSISERLKEMVYLTVSFVNECAYCSDHHETSAKKVGLTDEEIENLRAETDYHFTEQERAALRYARELGSAGKRQAQDGIGTVSANMVAVEATPSVTPSSAPKAG
jgi:uncharacterized peroxidase-related enzyme